jgi:hypothetical protein
MPSTRTSSATTPSKYQQVIYSTNATRYHLTQQISQKKDSSDRFLKNYDAWFDAFSAEVKDEFPSYTTTQRRQEAESRWSSFAAKSLKCSEDEVGAWLGSSSPRSTTY